MFFVNCKNSIRNMVPDKLFLKIKFKKIFNRRLNFKSPRTLNEKVQWLKIYDRNPQYINLVDKYLVKKIVSDMIGQEYIIPTLGVWDSANEIDYSDLPNQFVLKCTHDSGGVVVCRDKGNFDCDEAREKLDNCLKNNFFWAGREWPYKEIKPKIIAEKYLEDSNTKDLVDYKILCFNGEPQNIMVCLGRASNQVKYYFFDKNWKFLRYNKGDERLPSDFSLPKPVNLDRMIDVATILSKGIPLVRIDLYEPNGRLYFGEMTFYPDSGFDTDITILTDRILGEKLRLPFEER